MGIPLYYYCYYIFVVMAYLFNRVIFTLQYRLDQNGSVNDGGHGSVNVVLFENTVYASKIPFTKGLCCVGGRTEDVRKQLNMRTCLLGTKERAGVCATRIG